MNKSDLEQIRDYVDGRFLALMKGSYNQNYHKLFGEVFSIRAEILNFLNSVSKMPNEQLAGTMQEEYDKQHDSVNHPKHYTSHPSGVECIDITRHYCFSVGNALKYLWRAGLKKEMGLEDVKKEIEDLKKAIWYINDRIKQLENGN